LIEIGSGVYILSDNLPWDAGLAVTERIRDIGRDVLQFFFQTINSSRPQLIPYFLPYRILRRGLA